jgi:thymidylate kinase
MSEFTDVQQNCLTRSNLPKFDHYKLGTIVFEGLDRCGKDTQIKHLTTLLAKLFLPFHVLHYSGIPGIDSDHSLQYSNYMYADMFRMILEERSDQLRTFILNRSHLGEMVYGPIYRGINGNYVLDMERYFMNRFPEMWSKIFLITFIDEAENLIARDDGLSHSTDIDKKKNEIAMFIRATEKSHIEHKLLIDINGKDIPTVHDEVVNFIRRNC